MYSNEDYAFLLGDQYTLTREGVHTVQGSGTHRPVHFDSSTH